MTTIAYRADVLSFDSQVATGDPPYIGGSAEKGGRLADGSLWAFCGNLHHVHRCKWWLALPLNDPPELDEDSALIVIRRDGAIMAWEKAGWVEFDAPFYAWGTGDMIAMGAMHAGATAEMAVQIAANLDPFTGGKIHALTLAQIYAPPDDDLEIPETDEAWLPPDLRAVDARTAMREKLGLE